MPLKVGRAHFPACRTCATGQMVPYLYRKMVDGTACTNSVFGDIALGQAKQCHIWVWDTTDWTFCASEGGTCGFAGTQEVRYGANGSFVYRTLTGGTACTNGVFGDPLYGTIKQCQTRGASTILPPPLPLTYGPSATITCPVGAYDLWPGSNIPYLISFQPAGTTYCLRTGVHAITGAITPKRGDTFVGEFGAILDGSGWRTSDDTAGRVPGAQPGHRLRDDPESRHPQHAPAWDSCLLLDGRSLDDRTQRDCQRRYTGLVFPADSIIRNNYIHHNDSPATWA